MQGNCRRVPAADMASYLIPAVLALFGNANANPLLEHLLMTPGGRIVGGQEISIEEVPHQVSLQLFESHFCGGSIVNREYVVTAGHCADYARNAEVRAGSTFSNKGGSLHKVVKVIRHEKYGTSRRGEPINDIAVLKVSPPFALDETRVPINLYFDSKEILEGEVTTISGWGVTSEGGQLSNHLMAVSIPIVSRGKCSKIYEGQGLSEINEGFICAGTDKGGMDSCQGDSGGPVVVKGQLAGIVSYGLGCARPGVPGVYTNVAHYTKWIADHTE